MEHTPNAPLIVLAVSTVATFVGMIFVALAPSSQEKTRHNEFVKDAERRIERFERTSQ